MASLFTKTKLYIEANSDTWDSNKVSLQNDGSGDYIKTWAYSFDRRSQYGTWQQQMEMIYKDQKNGTSTFKDHCDKVRSDNPKG
jgi:hypothetical protein